MASILGFGSYLPERVVGNDELAQACGVDAEWIFSASGIRERRYAATAETVASLGLQAAQDCLARCRIPAARLGMILVASGSAERFCPGPAATLAAELGCAGLPALDIPVASAGSLIAIAMAAQFAQRLGTVLVVGSEIMSRRVDRTPEGQNTAILFGDGAGAALVIDGIDDANAADATNGNAPEGHSPHTPLHILDFALHTDGTQAEILKVEADRLHMDGGSVILQAARKIPAVVKELLDRNRMGPDQIRSVVMHQANLNLIARVAKSTAVPLDRFFVNIERFGNTSSASLLIAAAEWWSTPAARADGPVILAAFGAGLNWGAMLLGR